MNRGLKLIIATFITINITAVTGVASTLAVSTKSNSPIKSTLSNEVKTEVIKKTEKNIDIDLKIPNIIGIKNKAMENKINSIIKSEILRFSNETRKQADRDAVELKKDNIQFNRYSAGSDFSLKYLKNNIVSITVDEYSYTGGAHGMTNRIPYNINTQNGRVINLKDIFRGGYNYKAIINKEIIRQMKLNKDMMYFDEKMGGFKSIRDNQSFYIKDGKVVLYFDLYEIAPYAAGFPEFEISLKLFNGNLNKEYKI